LIFLSRAIRNHIARPFPRRSRTSPNEAENEASLGRSISSVDQRAGITLIDSAHDAHSSGTLRFGTPYVAPLQCPHPGKIFSRPGECRNVVAGFAHMFRKFVYVPCISGTPHGDLFSRQTTHIASIANVHR
jgi:hypothetical protein